MITTRIIEASECATDPALSLQNIYLLIQDATTNMLDEMHCDNITLTKKYNMMMVFTKHKAKVLRRPKWKEKVVINCRIAKVSKLLCYAKTEVFDESGNVLIDSVIECCCLDKKTFKILPMTNLPIISTEEDIDIKFGNFNCEELSEIKTFKVVPTLCDMLGHMNNAKAIFPFADSLEFEDFNNIFSHKFEIAVKYNAQAMMGTNLSLSYFKSDDGYRFCYLRAEDKSLVEQGYIKFLN